ncbi:MAG: fluoride efflux transporter CrcB [Bacteroidales bacterium]|nr:fluoride efflux transporter CrcB [Bacteroidales bacterium]
MVKSMLFAGFGGFIGTVLRFLVSKYFQINFDTVFPWGTLIINIAGSFLIGIFLGIFEKGFVMSSEWRLFFTVGICGGFTTFSTFSNDSFMLLQNKEILKFSLYAGMSFVFGIVSVLIGKNLIETI